MKALVINDTRSHYGFIIDVEQNRDGSYYDSAADLVYQPRELQFQWEENPTPVDWDAFRREAAKDILPTLIEKASEIYEFESLVKDVWCKQAVEWADELIRQLKQE